MCIAHLAFLSLLLTLAVSHGAIASAANSAEYLSAPVRLQQERSSRTWISMGPSPIENCGSGVAVICSGRVTAIAIDPNNSGTIYIGGAQGGVWKSTNGGSGWVPLTDDQPSLAIGAIAIAPNGNLYVGTGEGNHSGDSYYGAGILKSTDGGKTWVQLGASVFGRSAFTKIIVNPRNPTTIIAATTFGNTGSSTGGIAVNPGVPWGVFLSTDAGNSWTLKLTAKFQASDLAIDPTSASTIYAAVDGAVYASTDNGSTWTGPLQEGLPAPSKVGRMNLAVSVAPPRTLFAAVEEVTPDSNSRGALYRSTNGASSWSVVLSPTGPKGGTFCETQCWYDMVIAVDPTDVNTIYLGGLHLYRSTDGGATWTDLLGQGYIHVDQHALAFSPASHSTIYIGNDGGLWSSSNANTCLPSSCWTNLNSGLTLTQFQSLAAHPSDKNAFFGGTQDNGTPIHRGTSSVWTRIRGGDGGWTAFDPKNPRTMYHTFQEVDPARSDDGGLTWTSIKNGLDTKDKALFYNPMALSPNNPSKLYLGTYRLYKTANKGENWFLPNPGLSFSASGGCRSEDCIAVIAVAPSNEEYVYVATTTGKFFVSRDGGDHFSESDRGLPGRRVTKIAIDPRTPEKAYVTVTGFGVGHVFSTGDAGASWSDISSNLPDFPATAITFDPTGAVLLVGTDIGVYASYDGGAHWSAIGPGLPRVAVFEMVFAADGTLLAATHGRGVWRAILAAISTEPASAGLTVDGRFYFGEQLPLTFEFGTTHTVQISSIAKGPPGVRYVFVQWSDGSKDTTRTITFRTPLVLVAIFKTQYELKVISEFGNPQGSGWYDQGSQAPFSVTTPQPSPGLLGLLGGRVIFQGWSGNFTGTASTSNIKMDAPKTIQANWKAENAQAYAVLAGIGIGMTILVVAALVAMRRRQPAGATRMEVRPPPEPGIPPTLLKPPPRIVGISSAEPRIVSIAMRDRKSCMKCGAPLAATAATYCPRCGTKQF